MHSSIEIWYAEKQEFVNIYELVSDVEKGGSFTLALDVAGSARGGFARHLIGVAAEMMEDKSISISPDSNIVHGCSGIGKTTAIREIGCRLPKLFLDICCVLLPLNKVGSCPDIQDLVKQVKQISKKNKVILFIDDADAAFQRKDDSADTLVQGIANIYEPIVADVVVQIFGSSPVLPKLFDGSLDQCQGI